MKGKLSAAAFLVLTRCLLLLLVVNLITPGHSQTEKVERTAQEFVLDTHQRDLNHIKQHRPEMDLSGAEHGELEFHYFQEHDLDRDNQLDGLELLQALGHSHGEGEQNSAPSQEQIVQTVDHVLSQYDIDHDGYLTYAEYAGAKQLQAALDK